MKTSRGFGAIAATVGTFALGGLSVACGSGADASATGTSGAGGAAGKTGSSSSAGTGGGAMGSGGAGGAAGSASTSTSGGGGAGGAAPPMCTPTNGTVLAIDHLEFGDGAIPWSKLGFNLDGKVSTSGSADLCQPAQGASKSTVYPDGDNGLDNAFGKIVLPLLLTYDKTLSSDTNDNIAKSGEFTVMLDLGGLGAGADQSPIVTKLYGGGQLGAVNPTMPKFDGSDCWPVQPELLSNPADIGSATISFPTSKLAANHWDSTTLGTVPLTVPTSFGSISITIHDARIAMDLDPDHKGATSGIIGGVVDTEEFVAEVLKILQAKGLCFLASALGNQIRGGSDIMNDGTQSPSKTCNGISIGLGFTMKEVQFGGVGPKAAPPAPTCP